MSLRPFVIAWCLLVAGALVVRVIVGAGLHGGATAGLYALASLALLGAAAWAYRSRLRVYLRLEHSALWRSLAEPGTRRVGDLRLLAWLFAPDDAQPPDLRAARATGARVAVMLVTWLISTPAICIVLVLWR